MTRFSKGWALFLLALLTLLGSAAAGRAEAVAHDFGYTKNKAAVYGEASSASKTKKTIPAFTVVKILERGGKYTRIEDGSYLMNDDVGVFTLLGAQGKIVYWKKDQVLYATGNPNHPLKTKLPANTAVRPLYAMVEYYLVEWNGVYGFVLQKGALEPPKPADTEPYYTVLGPDAVFSDLPLNSAESDFRLPWEQGVILSQKAGSFYVFPYGDRVYYLPEGSVPPGQRAVRSRAEEGYADEAISLLDLPDGERGSKIGEVPKDTVCAMRSCVNGYVQVAVGQVTGFAREDAFTYPGGNGKDRYYLFLNKSNRVLTVYRADEQGGKTEEEVFHVTVAIGRVTSPTPSGIFTLSGRERWHSFFLSYAPYAMGYTQGRFIHGPLYLKKQESSIIAARLSDFGKMATGGCLRTPYEQVRWIYFHCPEGTTLEIVNGVKAIEDEM